jgi:ankyrin repeat protein
MKLLLEYQSDLLNKAMTDGRTPLMIAIDECFLNGIEYLLKQPRLERNACDTNGNTAIHHACMCTNASMRSTLLQLLIEDKHGIFDLEKRSEQLIDPFMLCTINESIDLCRLLIEKNVSLTKKDTYSRQSLHIACQMGNYELVSLLLNSSTINLNAVDANNRHCLFYAISYGDEKIVNLLIEKNINIKVRDLVGDTPLHLAVQHPTNAYELTKSLLKKQDGKDLINEPAADGMKPILLAAHCKQASVVHLLLKNGVDVKAVDSEQHTPLHLACKSDCMQSAFYLIEFGGLNVNDLDYYRQTPLFYAYTSNDYDLVQYLISCGAQIDVRDNQNYLPIHTGILLSKHNEDYNLNLIDLYKDKHEDLLDDQNNESQISPLLLACMQGKFDIVKHLILNYKINIMSKCSNGHTALHYACLVKNSASLDIIKFLMEHGCTYENVDQPKGSFLFTIVQHGDRQAAMYFIDYWLVSYLYSFCFS